MRLPTIPGSGARLLLPFLTLVVLLVVPFRTVAAQQLLGVLGPMGLQPSSTMADQGLERGLGLTAELRYEGLRPWLEAGASLGWATYAHYRDLVDYTGTSGTFSVELSTGHAVVDGHLFLRLRPPRGRIRPFVESLAGFTYLYTRSELIGIRADEYDPVGRSFNVGDTVLSWGIGGGLSLRLGPDQRTEGPPMRPGDGGLLQQGRDGEGRRGSGIAALEVGLRYISGPTVSFVRKRSIRIEGNDYLYDTDRAPLGLLQLDVHVVVAF